MSGEVTKCLMCDAVVAGDRAILHHIGWRQVGDGFVCPECRKTTEPEIVVSPPPAFIMPTGMPPI